MKLLGVLKFMFILFCVISTFQIFLVAGLSAITNVDFTFTVSELLQIPFISFMGVLPTLIFAGAEPRTQRAVFLREAAHFILTAGIVFGLLSYFDWIGDTRATVIPVILFFGAVYFGAYFIQFRREKKLADRLNERISKMRGTDTED